MMNTEEHESKRCEEIQNVKSNMTKTQILQEGAEQIISERVLRHLLLPECYNLSNLAFNRDKHIKYLNSLRKNMGPDNEYLDASGPWVLYWLLNSLTILNEDINEEFALRIARYLESCQDSKSGAFGGGEGQIPHIGVTYAAICVISMLGESYMESLIDRHKLLSWIHTLKQPDGSIAVHEYGEADLRGSYCAVAVASMLNLKIDGCEQLGDLVASCQTYEGGLAGVPGGEAHGGYTYCGLATLVILQQEHKIDVDSLARWATSLHGFPEGGFRGRVNKLVDGCYSFWLGGAITLSMIILGKLNNNACVDIFNREALKVFLLSCCQCENGGFSSSPNRTPDLYHTCYCISGYSLLNSLYARYESENVLEASKLYSPANANQINELTYVYEVEMVCEGCSKAVERVLKKEPKIKSYVIDLHSKKVTAETETLNQDQVLQILEKTGKKVKALS